MRAGSQMYCTFGVVCVLLTGVTACMQLPRDPERTLQTVQHTHRIRVGVVQNPPWIIRTSGDPVGVEAELVREFARSVSATPQWFWDGEDQELHALGEFGLDMVIADLDGKTPWAKTIGLTHPYLVEDFVVGLPPGQARLDSLQGTAVGFVGGDLPAAYLTKEGAHPSPVANLSSATGPVAGPEWLLRKSGFTLTRFSLYQRKHVIAVPPGENAWLKQLDDFLKQHASEVQSRVEASEAHL
jgi:polar amino acid transport system substrate-binding protein